MKAALLLLCLALCGAAHAQQTWSLRGRCFLTQVGQVRDLKAVPGNGRIDLSWRAPAGGACVDAYVVEVM